MKKLNLGCGYKKRDGFINVDSDVKCNPDLVWDLDQTPYPFQDNEIDEIHLEHVLEHLGQDVKVYFNIWKEFYRICKPNAMLYITVPHHRSDNLLHDPTHVRAITPAGINLFSQKLNQLEGASSKLGIRLDIDFEVLECQERVGQDFKYNPETYNYEIGHFNNIAQEWFIKVKCIK